MSNQVTCYVRQECYELLNIRCCVILEPLILVIIGINTEMRNYIKTHGCKLLLLYVITPEEV